MFPKHFWLFLVYLLLESTILVLSKTNICDRLKPCADRGKCVHLHHVHSKNILSTKCNCLLRYTGQWCQFVDGEYKPSKKAADVPRAPTIVTNTKTPAYNLNYTLIFKGVKYPSAGNVLYYIIRYNDYSGPKKYEWRTKVVPETKGRKVYTVIFSTFDWGYNYNIELYAGNKHGLGPPVKRIIYRPKVSIPRIVETSGDQTGSKAICCKTPLKLFCKANGVPAPNYSWQLNGKPVKGDSDSVTVKGGYLNILKPSATTHKGVYRCLATNAWGTMLSRPIQVEFSDNKEGNLTNNKSILAPETLKHRLVSGINLYQGTSLALTCGNDSKTENVQWFINGKPLENRIEKMKGKINGQKILYSCYDGRLEIPSVEAFVSGVYQCDVKNELGFLTMAEYVHVRDFDQLDPLEVKHKRSSTIYLEEGSSATLTCMPKPFHTFPVLWENFHETHTSHFREMENGFLEIHGVKESDNLKLSCSIPSHYSLSITRNIQTSVLAIVHGGWSEWSVWSMCKRQMRSCTELSFLRTRTCNNPAPDYDGKYCAGSNTEKSEKCNHGLGMENGEIRNYQITSSHKSLDQVVPSAGGLMKGAHPEYARLNGQHAWCGQVAIPSNEQNYLEIFFGYLFQLTGIATQGMSQYLWYHVASYTLRFSMDGQGWFDYSKPNKVWEGNSLNHITRKHTFDTKVYANFMRIYVKTYVYVPCLRFELYGCPVPRHVNILQTREYVKDPPKQRGKPIALEGIWSEWSPWSQCISPDRQACGDQSRMRIRECHKNLKKPIPNRNYQLFCKNVISETESCKKQECPAWSSWAPWKVCQFPVRDCEKQTQARTRNCSTSDPRFVRKYCPGKKEEVKKCTREQPCAVYGGWSSWSNWTACSVSCDHGTKFRVRSCTNPAPRHGGVGCEGINITTTPCYSPCPVHGNWSSWSLWSACSTSCDKGLKSRVRTCSNPVPQYGGMKCKGEDTNATQCVVKMCKVDGGWSLWSEWSHCSASCNAGIKYRRRSCTNPIPKYGGMKCEGEELDLKKCHTISCKVHGGWTSWARWSPCSVSCGSGVKTRTRSCSNPTPQHGGKECYGEKLIKTKCNAMSCEAGEAEEHEEEFSSEESFIDNIPLVTAAAGSAAFSIIIFICCCCCLRRKKSKTKQYKALPTTENAEPWIETEGGTPAYVVGDTSFEWPLPPNEYDYLSSMPSGQSQDLPPPPPPSQPMLASSQEKRRPKLPPMRANNTFSNNPIYDELDGFGDAFLEGSDGIMKSAQVSKTAKMPRKESSKSRGSTYGEAVGFDNAILRDGDGDIKGAQVTKTPKIPQKESKKSRGSTHGETVDFGNAILEHGDGNIRGAQVMEITKRPKLPKLRKECTKSSESIYKEMAGFEKAVLESESGKVREAQVQKISKLKKESNAPTIPENPSVSSPAPCPPSPPPSPPTPSPPGAIDGPAVSTADSLKSGEIISSSESTYESGLIGFENAILEPGEEDIYIKKAKIQKIKSKKKQKKTKE